MRQVAVKNHRHSLFRIVQMLALMMSDWSWFQIALATSSNTRCATFVSSEALSKAKESKVEKDTLLSFAQLIYCPYHSRRKYAIGCASVIKTSFDDDNQTLRRSEGGVFFNLIKSSVWPLRKEMRRKNRKDQTGRLHHESAICCIGTA